MGLKKLFDSGYKEMKRCEKLAYKIEALDEEMQKLSDDELKAKTPYFKELLKNGKTLDDILVPSQRLRALSYCSHAVRDDLKRDLAVIRLLFVSGDDLKQDLPGITLKIVKARKKVVNLGKL